MNKFVSCLNTWLAQHKDISLRQVAISSGVDPSMLSMIRSGKRQITQEAISKLLPTVERHSDRPSAITLLIAYLTDETPASHTTSIRIESIDTAGKTQSDIYQRLANRWEKVARSDHGFMAMWQGLDKYMHSPEALSIADAHDDCSCAANPSTCTLHRVDHEPTL